MLAVLLLLFYWLLAFIFGFFLLAIRKKEKDWENREKTNNCEHLGCLNSSKVPLLRCISIEHTYVDDKWGAVNLVIAVELLL